MVDTKRGKRYNLAIPQALYDEVQRIADEKNVPTVTIFRQYIKLGLMVSALEKHPDAQLIIREGGEDRQVVIL